MEKSISINALAFINLAAFLTVIVFNTLANTLPFNGKGTGELSDIYPNLFVPAGLTFSIWGLIYILLAGFAVYSTVGVFKSSINLEFLKVIGPWFLISCIANISWLFAWHWEKTGLSLIIMLVILLSLVMIYIRLGSSSLPDTSFVLVKLPFSVYLGWITVATIANTTALLVRLNWDGFGLSQLFWTAAVIAAAVIVTCLIIIFRNDLAYSLVIIWALVGIIIKRTSAADAPAVVFSAAAAIVIIIAVYIVKKAF